MRDLSTKKQFAAALVLCCAAARVRAVAAQCPLARRARARVRVVLPKGHCVTAVIKITQKGKKEIKKNEKQKFR